MQGNLNEDRRYGTSLSVLRIQRKRIGESWLLSWPVGHTCTLAGFFSPYADAFGKDGRPEAKPTSAPYAGALIRAVDFVDRREVVARKGSKMGERLLGVAEECDCSGGCGKRTGRPRRRRRARGF
jgi:hypothetical protein